MSLMSLKLLDSRGFSTFIIHQHLYVIISLIDILKVPWPFSLSTNMFNMSLNN